MTSSMCMSDMISCNNIKYSKYLQTRANDDIFCLHMNGCKVPGKKNVDNETELWRKQKEAVCGDLYFLRGGNSRNHCRAPEMFVGFDNFDSTLHEYLLAPCKYSTYTNHIECDDNKCCSVRHQLFMNHTKRI